VHERLADGDGEAAVIYIGAAVADVRRVEPGQERGSQGAADRAQRATVEIENGRAGSFFTWRAFTLPPIQIDDAAGRGVVANRDRIIRHGEEAADNGHRARRRGGIANDTSGGGVDDGNRSALDADRRTGIGGLAEANALPPPVCDSRPPVITRMVEPGPPSI